MRNNQLVWVDLGLDSEGRNLEIARQLDESELTGFGFKTQLDDIVLGDKKYIADVSDIGRPHFADLKMCNGPSTMTSIAQGLGSLGVDYTNAWAQAESNLAKTMDRLANDPDAPKMLGVTFYTRWDEAYAQRHYGMTLPQLIRHWSDVAIECGVDGLILPGNMLKSVADLDTEKVTPGVRRRVDQVTDSQQIQVSTPFENVVAGATGLVVGSPIYNSDDPVGELAFFLNEVERARQSLSGTG